MEEILLLLTAFAESTVGQPFALNKLTAAQRRFMDLCVNLGVAFVPQQDGQQQQQDVRDATFAFAAPYALLLRQDAHRQTTHGKQPNSGHQGTYPDVEGNLGREPESPPQTDAAAAMQGPFHPWLPLENGCVLALLPAALAAALTLRLLLLPIVPLLFIERG